MVLTRSFPAFLGISFIPKNPQQIITNQRIPKVSITPINFDCVTFFPWQLGPCMPSPGPFFGLIRVCFWRQTQQKGKMKTYTSKTPNCMPPSTQPSISQITSPSLLEVRTHIAFNYLGEKKNTNHTNTRHEHSYKLYY